ncbi:MAG: SpoIIE family protein phosphatase [Lentisphaerae bacterium]|nr:SpoIIE family protein phosphatase [Lentisphaerota bacterium]
MADDVFIEVESWQEPKHGQPVAGDVFVSRKVRQEGRIVSVLSDGLGSGVKANVLATLTSSMALDFVVRDTDVELTARTIMDTLPLCSERQIAYSTFTIVDIESTRQVRLIEHENPPCLILRGERLLQCPPQRTVVPSGVGNVPRERFLDFTEFAAEVGDRIVFFSDGVNQSGMGRDAMPLGWGRDAVAAFAQKLIHGNPSISARDLARRIVHLATANDEGRPRDDITCAVVYVRQPRRLLVATGPPFDRRNDRLMAENVASFPGNVIVCGGTTASIVSRELGRPVSVELDDLDDEVPPASTMDGVSLITEGTVTLARVADMLEADSVAERPGRNAATRIVDYLLNSDVIQFLVGTRINEAHQDPSVPVELDLRRNLMKRIARSLEDRHLKETRTRYL